jgi:hypothetical protein
MATQSPLLARATAMRRKKEERRGWRKKEREAAPPLHPFLASSLIIATIDRFTLLDLSTSPTSIISW